MKWSDALVAELDNEIATTRKLLERIPDEKFDWKPHEKSMSAGKLGSHIADIPGWMLSVVNEDEFQLTDDYKPFEASNSEELLSEYDQRYAQWRAALEGIDDEQLMQSWALKKADGEVAFSMPRGVVIRSFGINHLVHHRGQLAVYLRLLDIPVPAIYGPSADEQK